MKHALILFVSIFLAACDHGKKEKGTYGNMEMNINRPLLLVSDYSEVSGLRMYYEIYGSIRAFQPGTAVLPRIRESFEADDAGRPLVLIHGGGSTIATSFGRVIPEFSEDRMLICVELQAHGRTGDRNRELTFEQDADDVAALLKDLGVRKADVLGFSNGGNTALQMAIRHPGICGKVIAASPLLKRDGAFPGFWEFMKNGTFAQMPEQYKQAFLEVNNDSAKLMNMYRKCAARMIGFKDFDDGDLKGITAPVLLINGDADVATSLHMVAMSELIPGCRLAIIPGGHGEYIGEITTLKPGYEDGWPVIPLVEKFLDGQPDRITAPR